MSYVEINGLGAPMYNEIKKLVNDKSKLKEWTTSNSSKEEIMSKLALRIAQKDVSFNEMDKSLYSEFGTFVATYTKGGHLQFGAISGKHDDRIMSLAIALQAKHDYDYKFTKTFANILKI